jgi:hypothetical protein
MENDMCRQSSCCGVRTAPLFPCKPRSCGRCGNSRDVGKAGLSLLYFGSVDRGISVCLGSPECSEQSDFSRAVGTRRSCHNSCFSLRFPPTAASPTSHTRGPTPSRPTPPPLFQRTFSQSIVRQGSRHGTVHRHPMGIRGRRIGLLGLFSTEKLQPAWLDARV